MAVSLVVPKHKQDTCADAVRVRVLDSQFLRQMVRGTERCADSVGSQQIGVAFQQFQRFFPEKAVHPNRVLRGYSGSAQQQNQLLQAELTPVFLGDLLRLLQADAADLRETLGFLFQNKQSSAAELLDDLAGSHQADALDSAGGEI